MKIRLFIILFSLSIGALFTVQAQCPSFSWAHASAASEFNDIGEAISIDTINNYIYVTGMYSNPGTFSGQNYLTHGMQDAFIAKLDLQGNYIWVKNGGGVQDDEGVDVAVDHQGNVYACGIVQGFAIFETDTTKGGKNYLVKYDSAGQIQWLKDYAINISALTIDHHGNLIICGDFNGNKPFEGDSLHTKGFNDIFIAKYSPSGNLLWKKQYGSPKYEYAYDVMVDKNNNVYVGGYFYDSLLIETTLLRANGAADAYIIKLDKIGNLLLIKQLGGSSADGFENFALDSENNLVVIGGYYYNTTLDTLNITAVADGYNQYIAKFDSNMRIKWAYTHNGRTSGIAIGSNDDILVTGYFFNKLYYNNPAYLSSAGYDDLVLFNLSKDGKIKYVKQAGGVETDQGHGIAAHPNGEYFVCGEFSGTAYFSDIELNAKPGSGPWPVADILIAKIENQFLQINAGSDTSISCDQSVMLQATSNIDGSIYNWYPSTGLNNPAIANPVAKPATTTNYRLTVTDPCNNKTIDYVKVTVINRNVTANAGLDQTVICGDSVSLGLNTNSNIISAQWKPVLGLSNANIAQPMASPLVPTNYTLTIEDACGNTTKDDVFVDVDKSSHFSYSLNGLEVSFGKMNTACTNFEWDFGNGVTSNIDSVPIITYASPGTYIVCLSCGVQPSSCNTCTTINLPGNGSGNTIGLDDGSKQDVFEIYPNPSDGSLYFNREIIEIKLYEVSGKLIDQQQSKLNQYHFSDHHPDGLYFLELKSEDQIQTYKVILKR